MTRNGRVGFGLGLVAVLLAASALAGREVSGRVDAAADGVVIVENIAGRIEIVGWDREEVAFEGTLDGDAEEVVLEGGRKVRLKVKYPRRARNLSGGAELVVHVPFGSRVDVECISADIEVRGVTGSVEAESISGNVSVIGDCAKVAAESISGNVKVDTGAASVEVSSISGRIDASGRVADVEAETVSGSIGLVFERFASLDVGSVSGDVDVTGDLAAGGKFACELHSGTLVLTVPADVNADFRVETFSGGIDNGFGQKSRRTSKYTPGRELEFSNGRGEAEVRIDTFSGDVVIRKR